MPQGLVHNDNKIFRSLLRNKISLFWRLSNEKDSFWVEAIEDYLLPTIIYDFYSNDKNKNFALYLEELDLNAKSFRKIVEIIENHLSIGKSLHNIPNIKLLGDIHPGGSTKYFFENSIRYSKYPDYGNLLSSLSKLIFEDYEKFFPKIEKNRELFVREYSSVNIQTSNPETISQFYFNLGRVIPFLLLIRAIDINAENMIVNLPYPVFFDMESIFSGGFSQGSAEYSIENSGLINVNNGNDSSIFTGGISDRDSLLKPLICGDSEKPYIGWRTKSKGTYDNIPFLNGKKVMPSKYIKEINRGYTETKEKILLNVKSIEEVMLDLDGYVRVIIRPTRIYRLMILKSCYPQIYNEMSRKDYFEKALDECGYIYTLKSKELIEDEVQAMLNLQIPVYYSSIKSNEVLSPMSKVVARWENCQYEVWKTYMQSFNEEFLNDQQNLLINSLI